MSTEPPDLFISRVFDAPRALVYRAFTDPEQLAAWWGPTGSVRPLDEMEFDVRPGGYQRFVQVLPDDPSIRAEVQIDLADVAVGTVLDGVMRIRGRFRVASRRSRHGSDSSSTTNPTSAPASRCASGCRRTSPEQQRRAGARLHPTRRPPGDDGGVVSMGQLVYLTNVSLEILIEDEHGSIDWRRPVPPHAGRHLGSRNKGDISVRPLRYSINVTLDGCCHHEAGLPPDEQSMRYWTAEIERADALLFGRVTYEMMQSAWRQPATGTWPDWMDEWQIPFAETIDRAKKHVVSSTLSDVDWNAELVRGDLGQAVQRLKQEPGVGLWVGGVTLPLALADLGLIDEYEFLVQPVLAGHGPSLLAGLRESIQLELLDRQEFRSGAVALRFRPTRGTA